MGQYLVMKFAELELVPKLLFRLLAQGEDLEHSSLVSERLARVDEVALDFGGNITLTHAGVFEHVGDGLFARPVFVVDPAVDDQTHRAHHLVAQPSKIVERILFETHFPCQPLGIECPAFRVGRERQHTTEERNTLQLLRDRYLEMMTWNAFVVSQRAHCEFRRFAWITHVRVEHTRS